MPRIVVRNLTKSFTVSERTPGVLGALRGIVSRTSRVVQAVAGVSFEVEAGEIVGYVGPNGAGKSTTVKLLTGILVPDSGHCEIMGRTPWKQRIDHVREIGAVFGQRTQLWWDLPAIESFELLRELYRVDMADYRRRKDELVQVLDLGEFLDTPVRQLSLGQRMRCDLAAALLHGPKVLFLDEPTIGLDALAKVAVREFVRRINAEQGTTVILTTHDMDDIEALCHRLMVVDHGRIVSSGTLQDLRRRVGGQRWLTIDLDGDVTPQFELPGVQLRSHDGRRLHLSFDPDKLPADRVIAQIAQRYPVRDLLVENPPIEHIIGQLYEQTREMDS